MLQHLLLYRLYYMMATKLLLVNLLIFYLQS